MMLTVLLIIGVPVVFGFARHLHLTRQIKRGHRTVLTSYDRALSASLEAAGYFEKASRASNIALRCWRRLQEFPEDSHVARWVEMSRRADRSAHCYSALAHVAGEYSAKEHAAAEFAAARVFSLLVDRDSLFGLTGSRVQFRDFANLEIRRLPPRSACFLLELLTSPETAEAITGDLLEQREKKFQRVLLEYGLFAANVDFWWQVIRSVPSLLGIRIRALILLYWMLIR